MNKSSLWLILFVVLSAALAGPALAECKVSGPSPMYLGSNATYEISVTVEPQGLCPLFFSSLSSAVHFSSADILAKPSSGKLASAGHLNFAYSAANVGHDHFSLSLCGTDTAGTGCDTLNYVVDVK